MKHGMRDPRQHTLVAGQFDSFERRVKGIIRICHVLSTDELLACKMRGGRYKFVDHRITSAAVIVAAAELFHFFRAYPGFALWYINHRAGSDRVAIHAVRLHTRFHAYGSTPIRECMNEPLLKEFMFCCLEVKTD